MFTRQKFSMLLGELLGTGLLTFLILSVQRSTIGVPFFVAAGAGLMLAVATYIFHESTGAHFNPAITIALWTARRVTFLVAVSYVIVQLLGGYLASILYRYFANTHLQNIGGHFTWKIFVAEAVGTIVFTLGIAATIYTRYTVGTVALFSGISYMIGILVTTAGNAALGLLNPAIALGVKAWTSAYVLGPIVGAIIGINLYIVFFAKSDKLATGTAALGLPNLKLSRSSGSSSSKKKSNSKK